MTRDQLAKDLITKGKAQGLNDNQIKDLLTKSLADFDQRQAQTTGLDTTKNIGKNIVTALAAPIIKGGQALGSLAASKGQTQELERQQSQESSQNQLILNKMNEARQTGNTAEYSRLQGLLNQPTTTISPKSLEQEFKTGQQKTVQSAIGLSTMAAGGLTGAGVPTTAGQAFAKGAALGAGGAIGASSADIANKKEYGKLATEVGVGALTGGLLNLGAYKLEKAAQKLAQRASKTVVKAAPEEIKTIEKNASDSLNKIREQARNDDFTLLDKIRSGEVLQYKNKSNSLINKDETFKVIDDIGLKYNNTNDLSGKAQKLATSIQDAKSSQLSKLADEGVKIDVVGASDIFDDITSEAISTSTKTKGLLSGIIRETTGKQNLAGANAIDADKLASKLGKQADTYFKASFDAQGNISNIDNYYIYKGLAAAKNYIRDQLDTVGVGSVSVPENIVKNLSELAPQLAQGIKQGQYSLADLNYIQAMLLNSQKLAKDTTFAMSGAGQSVFKQAGKGLIGNVPFIGQAVDIINEPLEVATTPIKAAARSAVAKGIPSLLRQASTQNVSGALSSVGREIAGTGAEVAAAGASTLAKGISKVAPYASVMASKTPVWDALTKRLPSATESVK